MSANMARQGGRVQLEQSNMRHSCSMAKMARGEISIAAIEETHCLINNPRNEVRDEKKQGVEFPGHRMVKSAIERQLPMVRENQLDSSLTC